MKHSNYSIRKGRLVRLSRPRRCNSHRDRSCGRKGARALAIELFSIVTSKHIPKNCVALLKQDGSALVMMADGKMIDCPPPWKVGPMAIRGYEEFEKLEASLDESKN